MKKPVTLQRAITYFSDADRAFDYAKFLRWPDEKVTCPRCCSESNSFVKTRKLWFCNGCKKQFTVKVGTIFEDSPIGLDKWMTAVWMICNCKNGISSYELHRSIGVTQKSAWFMLYRIRKAMKNRTFAKIGGDKGGPVEVDDTFAGGKVKNMHASKRPQGLRVSGKPTGHTAKTHHFSRSPEADFLGGFGCLGCFGARKSFFIASSKFLRASFPST
jgi:transposase-like protein